MNTQQGISRRGFLKSAVAVGAAISVGPALEKVEAATMPAGGNSTSAGNEIPSSLPHRTLGTGKAAFEVSALGFGVMGMTYNRSQHPDKKQCIRLLHEAVGEFRGKVSVTTKFGHEVIDGKATGRQDSRPETIRRYCEESLRRLRTLDFTLSPEEWKRLEDAVAAIPVTGDRYNAEQQKQVQ